MIITRRSAGLAAFPTDVPPTTTKLYLDQNAIEDLPDALALPHLAVLLLNDNRLDALPPAVASLPALTKLSVARNALREIDPDVLYHLAALHELDLDGNALAAVPRELGALTALRKLALDRNALAELPDQIFVGMHDLAQFSASGNHLAALPPSIGLLSSLTRLSLENNRLESLPPTIGRLANLRELSLAQNDLASVPASLGSLPSLCVLDLSVNKLRTVPPELGRLVALKRLVLSHNALASLPAALSGLPALAELAVAHNSLAELPDALGELSTLHMLDAEDNKLTFLPHTLGGLASLRVLNVSGNRLRFLPPTLGMLKSLQLLSLAGNPLGAPLGGCKTTRDALALLRAAIPGPGPSSFQDDLRRAVGHRSFADVRFVVAGMTIHAHRALLAPRCDQFGLWFRSGAPQAAGKVRDITITDDVPVEAFSALLEFLYAASVEDLSARIATPLRKLAQQYGVDRLQRICKNVGLIKHKSKSFEHERRSLSQGLHSLFLSEEFADVVFSAEDRHIPAHRIVLFCRCPELLQLGANAIAASTSANPARRRAGVGGAAAIVVPDVRFPVLWTLIDFLYADALVTDDLDLDDILDVMAAAHRFDVVRLRELCEEAAARLVTPATVCAAYERAYQSDANQLAAFCLQFILARYDELRHSSEFNGLFPALRGQVDSCLEAA